MFAGRVIEKRKGKVKQIMGEWNLGGRDRGDKGEKGAGEGGQAQQNQG